MISVCIRRSVSSRSRCISFWASSNSRPTDVSTRIVPPNLLTQALPTVNTVSNAKPPKIIVHFHSSLSFFLSRGFENGLSVTVLKANEAEPRCPVSSPRRRIPQKILLSRQCLHAGLVALRQTFVRRCQNCVACVALGRFTALPFSRAPSRRGGPNHSWGNTRYVSALS